jgi:hypothetical protein
MLSMPSVTPAAISDVIVFRLKKYLLIKSLFSASFVGRFFIAFVNVWFPAQYFGGGADVQTKVSETD